MCKHKSGGSRSRQDTAATSSCAGEAEAGNRGGVIAMETEGEVGPSHSVRMTTPVPVHQTYKAAVDDFNESSPMLLQDDNQMGDGNGCGTNICASCALPDCEKISFSECGEQSGLLQDTSSTIIQGSAVEAKQSKRHSRWRSGVVVYPSIGSLTTEWKDDVSQFNSLTNLGTDVVSGTHGDPLQSDLWYLKDCQVYNVDVRPRSVSLTHVNNSLDQYATSSDSTEADTAASSGLPLAVSPSPFLHHKLMKGLQYSSSVASSLTEGGNVPICKICHLTSSNGDPLISPCRCSGTMQFIHCNCLMKWLEYSSKRTRRPPTCELCQYQYHWHKKFKVGRWQFPHCSQRDKLFHVTFFLALMVMIACATITILCFKQDKGMRVSHDSTELSESEIVTLICGVLFFIAFFLAMYVEVKARNNVYRLFVKFLYLNQQWYFDEYEKKDNTVVSV